MLRFAPLLLLTLASPALAHPHVFIDASLVVTIDDQNRLTGLRLRWDYDNYVSLILATEKGADLDGDGTLTAAELAPLQGFDMTLTQGDQPIALQTGPQDWVTGWQDTHLWSAHGRQPLVPVDLAAGPVTVMINDPTDYTAYTLTSVTLAKAPPGCRIEITVPDESASLSGIGALLGLILFAEDDSASPTQITKAQEAVISCDG
jgi:ABC-type uncharacterized transport system substrate-binding protein